MQIDQLISCPLEFVALYSQNDNIIEKPILGFALLSSSKKQIIAPLIVDDTGNIIPQDLEDADYLGVCSAEDYEAKQRLALQPKDDEPKLNINQFGAVE